MWLLPSRRTHDIRTLRRSTVAGHAGRKSRDNLSKTEATRKPAIRLVFPSFVVSSSLRRMIGARMRIPFSPLRTKRFMLCQCRKPATWLAVGHCEALTHCPCFPDDSLSASPSVRCGGDDRSKSFVCGPASASDSATSSQRRSARGSRVDAR